eukprot:362952-Chlamydomonas_euryale.AAC.3
MADGLHAVATANSAGWPRKRKSAREAKSALNNGWQPWASAPGHKSVPCGGSVLQGQTLSTSPRRQASQDSCQTWHTAIPAVIIGPCTAPRQRLSNGNANTFGTQHGCTTLRPHSPLGKPAGMLHAGWSSGSCGQQLTEAGMLHAGWSSCSCGQQLTEAAV